MALHHVFSNGKGQPMVIEWLAFWGVTQATAFVFKPILEDLAKDAAKGVAGDYIKSCFKRVFSALSAEPLAKAMGQALKDLLEQIEEELLDNDVDKAGLRDWNPDVDQFRHQDSVKEALGDAFASTDPRLDPGRFAQGWQAITSRHKLPDGFSWERVAKRVSRKIKEIRDHSSELRAVFELQTLGEIAGDTRQIAGLPPGFDSEVYRSAVMERYGNLDFESLDTTGAYYGVKLWSVFVPQSVRECQEYYPQVLELPKEHLKRLRERGELVPDESPGEEAEERRRSYLEQPVRPVLEVVDDDRLPRLVILGDPGAGKSSLLRYLALRWARITDPNEFYTKPLPLLIQLREYDRWECPSNKSLLRYLNEAQTYHRLNQVDLDRLLQRPNAAVFFLDGLDEVFDPARREQVVNDIHRLSNEYPTAPIIVTSRVIGYKPQRLRDAEFRHFRLQDFESDQVEAFLDHWHDQNFTDPADRAFKRDRLAQAIEESRAIAELAGNPLLLTMMAILNRTQVLPRDRAELYQQAARVLLHLWDTERTLESHPKLKGMIGFPEKAEILRRVAWFMQSRRSGLAGNIIAREDLEDLLQDYLKGTLSVSEPLVVAHALVEQLRERNFILCYVGGDSYAFVHRTFLEFFCASKIVQQFQSEQSLRFEGLRDEIFGAHWADETWHEVLCLIAGMIGARFVAQLITFLVARPAQDDHKYHHVFLAAQCFHEVRNPAFLAAVREPLTQALVPLLEFDFPFWYDKWEETDLADQRRSIRGKTVRLLARPGLLPNPLNWLKDRAINDGEEEVREAAVQELARGWRTDPDTLPFLKDLVRNDRHWEVRVTAVEELARGWRTDADTLPFLKDLVRNDQDWDVRATAVRELARGWRTDADTLPILKDHVRNDGEEYVRGTAVEELARGWRTDADTLLILKDRARNDEHEYVRLAAVEELARGWRTDADTLPILKDRARNDEHGDVRETAVQELARGWRTDADTLPFLKDRARNDQHWDVRGTAVQELARGWRTDADTLPFLKDRVRNDQHGDVRETGVRERARGWRADADTLPILKDRARNDQDEYVRQAAVEEAGAGLANRRRHPP